MCAEAHPSQCHRKLLADALVLHGATVMHIIDAGRIQPHVSPPEMRQAACGVPIYPAAAGNVGAQLELGGLLPRS